LDEIWHVDAIYGHSLTQSSFKLLGPSQRTNLRIEIHDLVENGKM